MSLTIKNKVIKNDMRRKLKIEIKKFKYKN